MRRLHELFRRILWILFAALLLLSQANAGTATLKWTAPTKCADDSALSNCPITAYEIETAPAASGPWASVLTIAPTLSEYTLTIPPGTHFFRMLAHSKVGTAPLVKSGPSNVASKTVEPSTPNPPSAVVAE